MPRRVKAEVQAPEVPRPSGSALHLGRSAAWSGHWCEVGTVPRPKPRPPRHASRWPAAATLEAPADGRHSANGPPPSRLVLHRLWPDGHHLGPHHGIAVGDPWSKRPTSAPHASRCHAERGGRCSHAGTIPLSVGCRPGTEATGPSTLRHSRKSKPSSCWLTEPLWVSTAPVGGTGVQPTIGREIAADDRPESGRALPQGTLPRKALLRRRARRRLLPIQAGGTSP